MHIAIFNRSEYMVFVMGTNCNEVVPVFPVIEVLKALGFSLREHYCVFYPGQGGRLRYRLFGFHLIKLGSWIQTQGDNLIYQTWILFYKDLH